MKRILVWFRNDLRLQDHEPLHKATQKADEVIPYYCFDTRQFAASSYGFPKTGPFRAKFLLESVAALQQNCRTAGGDLLIDAGVPEEQLLRRVKELQINAVYAHSEVTDEEIKVEESVEQALWKAKVPLETFWGHTLYHLEDLPFPIKFLPETFADFRKQVERYVNVREPLPAVDWIKTPKNLPKSEVPALSAFGIPAPVADLRAVMTFTGGEKAAWQRLQEFIWDRDLLKEYQWNRDKMLGADYSSKLAPWLANGSISARSVYQQVQQYEQVRRKNESTGCFRTELLWRDFYWLLAKKHANHFYKPQVRFPAVTPPADHPELFERWRNGTTGIPFVDAHMQELQHSGYLSSRGRQAVAGFLVNDLRLNWEPGAAWFASQLLDNDPAINWGNWNYIAAGHSESRENRPFSVLKQAQEYDPHGEYVKHWLPVLAPLPRAKIHTPWLLTPGEQTQYGIRLGQHYPEPILTGLSQTSTPS